MPIPTPDANLAACIVMPRLPAVSSTSRAVNGGNFVYIKENAVDLGAVSSLIVGQKTNLRHVSSLAPSPIPTRALNTSRNSLRGILNELVLAGYQGKVSILTKSPMVLRDIDLLQMLNADVGLTITTTDDQLGRFLEVRAPLESKRLDTLRKLNEAGIPTYAFVGPLLPHFREQPDQLESIFKHIAESGHKRNLRRTAQPEPQHPSTNLGLNLPKNTPIGFPSTSALSKPEHRAVMNELVAAFSKKYNLHLRLNEAIYHHEMKKN